MIADGDGITLSSDLMIFFLLLLYSADFLDFSGVLVALAITGFLFLRVGNLEFDAGAGLLILFSAFYFGSVAYHEGTSIDTVIKFAIAPWGCYVLGYNMRLRNRAFSVTDFATALTFGFFLHGMLNLYSSIQVFGSGFNNNYRQAIDFWQSRTISVTTASLYYTPFTVMSVGLLFFSTRRGTRPLAAISLAMGLYASMIYQNRTLILDSALIFCLDLLLFSLDAGVEASKKHVVYGCLAIGALLAVLAFLANVAGIRDTIMNSSLMNRMTGSKQDRTTIWISFIFGEAWKYPFGGTKAVLYENKPFCHNMWLDTFRRAGFFPFLFLGLFTLRSALNILYFNTLGRLTGEDTCVIISLFAGTMLSFMVEPVIEANPYVFYLPLLVVGVINGHNRDVESLIDYYAYGNTALAATE